MEHDMKKIYHSQTAYARMGQIKKFYARLMVYCVVNAAFFCLWLYDPYVAENFWIPTSFFTVVVAGLFILANGVNLFGGKYLYGKKWEERRIKKIISKENIPTIKYE